MHLENMVHNMQRNTSCSTSTTSKRKCALASAAILVAVATSSTSSPLYAAEAFAPTRFRKAPSSSMTYARRGTEDDCADVSAASSRREVLGQALGSILGGTAAAAAVLTSNPREASATYSAYAAREKDWQERQANGEVKFSNARELRTQLREIVPQNSEKSKVFCPNGPSAAVSPLMENKCNDQLAMPSVYGRTTDITGNSIPGFAGGRYAGVGGGTVTVGSGLADAGGFPAYKAF